MGKIKKSILFIIGLIGSILAILLAAKAKGRKINPKIKKNEEEVKRLESQIQEVNVKKQKLNNELTELINITPLSKSINFNFIEKKISKIAQIHYFGNKDKVIPNALQQSFYIRNKENPCIKIKKVEATHNKGWLNFWRENYNIKKDCS